MLLGNDLVDLQINLPLRKEADTRFLQRVFTEKERDCIHSSATPGLALWLLWAAKESLFKAGSKLEPGLIFSHSRFTLPDEQLPHVSACGFPTGSMTLQSKFSSQPAKLHFEWTKQWIHCVAALGHAGSWVSEVAEGGKVRGGKLTAREEESVHSEESREVRLLAHNLLSEHFSVRRAEVVRTRKAGGFHHPTVLVDSSVAQEIDISLSHDGAFVAACCSRSAT